MYRGVILAGGIAALVAAGMVFAQHDYPATDIERGGQYYRGNCIGCHGPDGDLLEDVSLADPAFLQDMSDEQLIAIIINGVPETAMLANNYSELQAGNIVAYLRNMSQQGRLAPVNGNPERGRELFLSYDCMDCHRIGRQGSRVGPDLSRIGLLRRTSELEEALLDPDATVLPENRYVNVVTGQGTRVTGRLLNHDLVTVQLLDSDERLRLFRKQDLREFEIPSAALMPSYADRLGDQDLEDLLSYLVSLKEDDSG